MKKLSELQSPAVAGVIRERNARLARAEIINCLYDGADMIDLHLSCLDNTEPETLKNIINVSKLPVLALNYNQDCDWQSRGYTEEERAELFLRAIDAGAAGVDIQGYTFHAPSKNEFCGEDKYSFTKDNPKEVVTDSKIIAKQCEFIEKVHVKGGEVLLSCHPGVYMDARQVTDLALFLEKRNPDIIKIVTVARDEDELIESIKAMTLIKKEVKTKVSYHAAGECGKLSRLINPVLGGHIMFCVDRFSESSTLEQMDLRTARTVIDGLKKLL